MLIKNDDLPLTSNKNPYDKKGVEEKLLKTTQLLNTVTIERFGKQSIEKKQIPYFHLINSFSSLTLGENYLGFLEAIHKSVKKSDFVNILDYI